MSNIEQNLGVGLTESANTLVVEDRLTFGDPAAALMKKARMIQALLEIAGVTQGKAVTPQVVVALDAVAAVAGLVTAVQPDKALARFIATGITSAPLIDLAVRTDAKIAAAKAADARDSASAAEIAQRFAPVKQEA